jgi:DNA-binding transcriptional LysR family regulator
MKGADVTMRANSIISALNAALVGMGITVLPCFLGDDEPTLERLTPRILGSRDVMLVVHPDLSKVARVRAVMDFVSGAFQKEDALWRGDGRAVMMEKS